MAKVKRNRSTDVRRRTIGVYAIVHVRTRSAYVGGSKCCIYNRFTWHDCKLRHNEHPSVKFQELWNNTKPDEWDFRVLEICDSSLVSEREEFWCTQFKKLLCGHPATGFTHTIESRIKQKVGRAKNLEDPKARQLLSERAKAQHAAGKLGRATWTPGKERIIPEESRARMSKRLRELAAKATQA